MTEETTELVLPSRLESIADASAAAVEFARKRGFDDDALYGVDMAVREAVTNAVMHGNRLDNRKSVELKFQVSEAELEITVRDRGAGFNVSMVPDPTEGPNLLKASGRGILFIRTFMDNVNWFVHPEGGTVIRMTKKR